MVLLARLPEGKYQAMASFSISDSYLGLCLDYMRALYWWSGFRVESSKCKYFGCFHACFKVIINH